MHQTPIHERVIKSRGGLVQGTIDRTDDIIIPQNLNRGTIHIMAYQRRGNDTAPLNGRVDDEGIYRPMATEEGFSTMGFVIVRNNGRVDRFSYALMGDMEFYEGERGEYLGFVHRTKAVTLIGANLYPIVTAENTHTLSALYQYGNDENGKPLPYRKSLPLITDVLINDVNGRNDTNQ